MITLKTLLVNAPGTIRETLEPLADRYRLRHMLSGYARVSKADGSQSLDLQRDALRAEGADRGRAGARVPVRGDAGLFAALYWR